MGVGVMASVTFRQIGRRKERRRDNTGKMLAITAGARRAATSRRSASSQIASSRFAGRPDSIQSSRAHWAMSSCFGSDAVAGVGKEERRIDLMMGD
jgi:hypothetical protein